MRIHYLIASACITALTFTACSSGTNESSNNEITQVELSSTQDEPQNLKAGTVSKEQLEGMLSAYFDIKNALVDTHAENAKSATEKLMEHISEGMQSIKEVAQKIQKRETVEQIRADFEILSQDLYKIVKNNPDIETAPVYKQFCPMAFDNKGAYWLSGQEEIRNPYFGDKMLKCGKVQEKL